MLGSNVPTIGGIQVGFEYGDQWNCDCIQIYTTLSRRWDVPELTVEKIELFNIARKKSSVKKVIAHVPFLVNLASENIEIREKSIKRLAIEISRASDLGISFLVLHPGSCGSLTREIGVKLIIEGLENVFSQIESSFNGLVLETMAGQGTMIGSSFEEIDSILKIVKVPNLLGVCFDTAHVFEAGYNFRGYEGYEEVIEKFDTVIGLDKLSVIHINDSKTDLDSNVDRHTSVGEGKMGLQVFHALLRDNRLSNVPKILEIPERDQKSQEALVFLRKLESIQSSIEDPKSSVKQLKLSI